jgi:4-amino-4-deoxy-L-arabinose transferase-like glycosyltransferase
VTTSQPNPTNSFFAQKRGRALAILCVVLLSFTVRALTAQFMAARLADAAWFQSGTYSIFDRQARERLEGRASIFWIDDPARTDAAVYPPGYSSWLALVYSISGTRSVTVVQNVQWVLDALSVMLLVGIGVTAYGWRTGLIAGVLAALSPLLALYGATPLADAPTSWFVLGGVWMLLLAAKRQSWRWALGAGLMVGASCWLRANALLLTVAWTLALYLFTRGGWRDRARLSLTVMLGTVLLVAPIVARNAVAFHAFLPTGLGLGTNLWEGIGETERAAEFGAVYGDDNLLAQERAAVNLAPDAPLSLYHPDGVRRDRERARKALSVIISHPVWYTGVMLGRMWGVLNYAGEPSPFYGYAGLNVTSRKTLPPDWQGGALALFVNLIGMAQSVFRHIALPLMLCGVWLALRRNRLMTGLILTTVLYYLVVGSALHTEIRYGLPMQALLLIFAAFPVCYLYEIAISYQRSARKRVNG